MDNAKTELFFNATKDVLKKMLDIDISKYQSSSKDDTGKAVNVCIEFVGDVAGKVNFRFPKETVLNIVKTLSGMDTDEVDDFATSIVGEISNIISGNAAVSLSEKHLKCDIKAPRISVENFNSVKDTGVSIFLKSDTGNLAEQIGLSLV